MTQPRPGKILSALGLNKARTDLFLGRPYTPKRVLPIKVWITPYKPNISPVLCRCGIRLGCYTIGICRAISWRDLEDAIKMPFLGLPFK